MGLIQDWEKQGSWLFRYRGQIPVLLFLMAIPAVWLADIAMIYPLKVSIVSCLGILISFLGVFVRAYTIGTTPKGTSGRNTREQVAEQLNSTGIYSIVRHPLYLGNFLMWIGIVIYTLNFWFVLVVCLLYWLYYERIMFAEERFLEKKFGERFVNWSIKAPAFIPKFSQWIAPGEKLSWKSIFRREYSGWLATVIGFVYVDTLRESILARKFAFNANALIIMGFFLILTGVLRTLKHHTGLLHEQDRS